MSRYYSFNDFMNDVLEKADEISRARKGYGLEELYSVKVQTYQAVKALISHDWFVFLAVVALLVLGPVGFAVAIVSFFTTPVGIAVAAVLGVGAAATIKQMYQDRILPQSVRKVGEAFKPKWKQSDGNRIKIDLLVDQAAEELYQSAFDGLVRGQK